MHYVIEKFTVFVHQNFLATQDRIAVSANGLAPDGVFLLALEQISHLTGGELGCSLAAVFVFGFGQVVAVDHRTVASTADGITVGVAVGNFTAVVADQSANLIAVALDGGVEHITVLDDGTGGADEAAHIIRAFKVAVNNADVFDYVIVVRVAEQTSVVALSDTLHAGDGVTLTVKSATVGAVDSANGHPVRSSFGNGNVGRQNCLRIIRNIVSVICEPVQLTGVGNLVDTLVVYRCLIAAAAAEAVGIHIGVVVGGNFVILLLGVFLLIEDHGCSVGHHIGGLTFAEDLNLGLEFLCVDIVGSCRLAAAAADQFHFPGIYGNVLRPVEFDSVGADVCIGIVFAIACAADVTDGAALAGSGAAGVAVFVADPLVIFGVPGVGLIANSNFTGCGSLGDIKTLGQEDGAVVDDPAGEVDILDLHAGQIQSYAFLHRQGGVRGNGEDGRYLFICQCRQICCDYGIAVSSICDDIVFIVFIVNCKHDTVELTARDDDVSVFCIAACIQAVLTNRAEGGIQFALYSESTRPSNTTGISRCVPGGYIQNGFFADCDVAIDIHGECSRTAECGNIHCTADDFQFLGDHTSRIRSIIYCNIQLGILAALQGQLVFKVADDALAGFRILHGQAVDALEFNNQIHSRNDCDLPVAAACSHCRLRVVQQQCAVAVVKRVAISGGPVCGRFQRNAFIAHVAAVQIQLVLQNHSSLAAYGDGAVVGDGKVTCQGHEAGEINGFLFCDGHILQQGDGAVACHCCRGVRQRQAVSFTHHSLCHQLAAVIDAVTGASVHGMIRGSAVADITVRADGLVLTGSGAAGVLLVGKGFSAGIAGQRMSLAIVIGGNLYIGVTQTDREIICGTGCGSQLEGGRVDISVCQLNANGHFALVHGNQHGGPGVAILLHTDRARLPGGSQDAGCAVKVSREIDAVQFHCSHALAIRQTGNIHCQLCHFPFKGQIHRGAGNLCGAVEGLVVRVCQIIVKGAVITVGVIGGNFLAACFVIEDVCSIPVHPVGTVMVPPDIASRIAAVGIVVIGNRDTDNYVPFSSAHQLAFGYMTLGNFGCILRKFAGIRDLRRTDTCQRLTDRGLHGDLVDRQRFDAAGLALSVVIEEGVLLGHFRAAAGADGGMLLAVIGGLVVGQGVAFVLALRLDSHCTLDGCCIVGNGQHLIILPVGIALGKIIIQRIFVAGQTTGEGHIFAKPKGSIVLANILRFTADAAVFDLYGGTVIPRGNAKSGTGDRCSINVQFSGRISI